MYAFFFLFLFQNSSCVLYTVCHRQNVIWPKKIPLLSKRYLSLVAVHETYNKELTSETYWKNKMTTKKLNTVIIKTFLVWNQIRNVQQNWRITARKLSSWRFISFCQNKAFCFESIMQFCWFRRRSPYLCMLLLEHCDTWLRLQLFFQNNNDNNYNNSHAHTHTHSHTFRTNFFTQKAWASRHLRAKSRSRTACDVEIIKS